MKCKSCPRPATVGKSRCEFHLRADRERGRIANLQRKEREKHYLKHRRPSEKDPGSENTSRYTDLHKVFERAAKLLEDPHNELVQSLNHALIAASPFHPSTLRKRAFRFVHSTCGWQDLDKLFPHNRKTLAGICREFARTCR